jgi:hypothetical protein
MRMGGCKDTEGAMDRDREEDKKAKRWRYSG